MRLLPWLLLFLALESTAGIAIVTHDRAPLRNAAGASAQVNAFLLQGEALEVRGERLDYLQVYDYRRERAGFVRASQVRRLEGTKEEAAELLAVLRFLRTTPNAETLGIALAVLYLQVAAPEAASGEPGVEALDALGTFAERLAARGSAPHLEVAARYGIGFRNVEREGRIVICYDGEAFRRLLAMPASEDQRARAALALTRRECAADELQPLLRMRMEAWRAEVLERVDARALPSHVRNRVLLRRAGVWAGLAYYRARGWGEEGEPAMPAAQRAIAELRSVERAHLAEEDRAALRDATRRVHASRWAAVPPPPVEAGRPHLVAAPGAKPGETCVTLVDRKPALRRCTYGLVWLSSARLSREGQALDVAVQHTETVGEAWTFRRAKGAWRVRVRPLT